MAYRLREEVAQLSLYFFALTGLGLSAEPLRTGRGGSLNSEH